MARIRSGLFWVLKCPKKILNLGQNYFDMERSVREKIERKIKKRKRGQLYVPDDFMGMGNTESVKKALFRLEKKGVLMRLAHGIYVYPQKDKMLGTLLPSAEEVAEMVARRDRARIIPDGILAMNLLGLSPQVPMNLVYLTDGSPREISIGKRKIRFKKVAPKNLALKGKITSLAIQALKVIGKGQVTPNELERIQDILRMEERGYVIHDAALAPAWIRKIMLETIKSESTDGKLVEFTRKKEKGDPDPG